MLEKVDVNIFLFLLISTSNFQKLNRMWLFERELQHFSHDVIIIYLPTLVPI